MELTLIITGIILLGCFLGLSWFAGSDAPFVRTRNFAKILKTVDVKKGKKFYDLGSGDGRLVLEAAKMGADSFGIEQSWIRVLYSRYMAKKLNLPNAKFIHGNIFFRNYVAGDIIYIYLLQKNVEKLEPILKQDLKKGSKIITKDYHFKNLEPIKKIDNFWIYQV